MDTSVSVTTQYQSGFGNEFATEALPGALPKGRNSPQQVPYGLYAEQFSGTAFTAPRDHNLRTWFYRIRPSVKHKPFKQLSKSLIRGAPFGDVPPNPNQMRWDPLPIPDDKTDFISGLVTMMGALKSDGLPYIFTQQIVLWKINIFIMRMEKCYLCLNREHFSFTQRWVFLRIESNRR